MTLQTSYDERIAHCGEHLSFVFRAGLERDWLDICHLLDA